uniref:ATP synthase subunit a n=1 Tax=Colossendeis brevirostris TaxID=619823 RepID=A0A9E8ABT5_9CHEL|nr:ATP synthase F0 subunit 6 [Colossendeis brevirostris]UYX57806.1 ATP synthase F0 subunit 6 [Colossendeis brevirostris]
MMTNLFSIFDPTSSLFKLHFNWLSMSLIMLFSFKTFWLMTSRWNSFMLIFTSMIKLELKNNIKNNQSILIFITVITFIMANNMMGLFSYVFTASSHISMTLVLALIFWFSYMLYSWVSKISLTLAHLVPLGTPFLLMFFMVIIESVSNIIRPITLSIRLAANMTAGHLLISLMSSSCSTSMISISLFIIIMQCLLMILELAVALIQAYVFTILISLYYNEVN